MVMEGSKCHELAVEESFIERSPAPKETSNKNVLVSVQQLTPINDTPVPNGRVNRFVPILIEEMSGSQCASQLIVGQEQSRAVPQQRQVYLAGELGQLSQINVVQVKRIFL